MRKTGDLPDAVRELQRAVELDKSNADYHRNLAETYQSKGDLAGFVQEYREEVRLRPNDPDAHLHLANAYLAVRDWPIAQRIPRGAEDAARQPGVAFHLRHGT